VSFLRWLLGETRSNLRLVIAAFRRDEAAVKRELDATYSREFGAEVARLLPHCRDRKDSGGGGAS
jgi:hypothetical protein